MSETTPYDFYNPTHQSLSVEIKNSRFIFHKGTQWESRNDSMEKLLLSLEGWLTPGINKKIIINTGDHPIDRGKFPYPVLSFSTKEGFRDLPIPCFVYDHWMGAKIGEWEKVVESLSSRGSQDPNINKLVWLGAQTNRIRCDAQVFFSEYKDIIDFELIDWGQINSNKRESRYLSLEDHLNYKVLLDLPGNGFSARIYYFFFCKRPIIKLYDDHKLWFDDYLPENTVLRVKDLDEVLNITSRLLSDSGFYKEVICGTWDFAQNYLTKEMSMKYLFNLINDLPSN
jgi:hypothetical protein